MKKSLIAVAVAAALPAAAFAQTNVTMYGIVDVGITSTNDGVASTTRVESGLNTTNRWGVRGTESLGGGLNAMFNLEAGIRSDTGSGTTAANTVFDFNRRAVVGLNGGFGEVRLGRDYTPLFKLIGTGDAFGYTMLGNLVSNATLAGANSVRFSNAIFYNSPDMGGLTAALAYSMGEVAGNNSAGRGLGANVAYAAGPLNVGLGYEAVNDAAGNNAYKTVAVAGGYNFGAFGLKAGWNKVDKTGNAITGDVTSFNIGGNVVLGAGNLIAQVDRRSYETGGRTTTFALGYVYPMSKRTSLYGTLGNAANSGLAAGNTKGGLRGGDFDYNVAGSSNNTVRSFGVGLRHDF